MFHRVVIAAVLIMSVFPLTKVSAAEPKAGEHVVWAGEVDDDIFSAGQNVDVDGTVKGDAFVAGGDVSMTGVIEDSVYTAGGDLRLRGDVANDLIAAGGDVQTDGHIGDNLVLAGGDVRVASEVGGRAIVAGGNVRLENAAVIHGDAWLAGGNVSLDGDVGGGARLTGGQIVIRGHVAGDVRARGQDVRVASDARIDGNLSVLGPNKPQIEDGAVISGTTDYQETERGPNWARTAIIGVILVTLVIYFFLFLVGLLIILICPGFVVRNREILATQGLAGFGIGALIVIVMPMILFALLFTVVGIPFAVLGFLLYCAALMLSIPFVGTTLAHRFAGRKDMKVTRGRLILAYAGILLVFWILGLIPFLGGLIWTLLSMLGLGVVTIQMLPMFKQMQEGVEPA